MTLTELLEAAGVAQADIVAGDVWRVKISGDEVVLVRHITPTVINPGQGGGPR